MTTLYATTFIDQDGNEQASRIFQNLPAARAWKKWLNSTTWAKDAKIYRGGVGCEIVK